MDKIEAKFENPEGLKVGTMPPIVEWIRAHGYRAAFSSHGSWVVLFSRLDGPVKMLEVGQTVFVGENGKLHVRSE